MGLVNHVLRLVNHVLRLVNHVRDVRAMRPVGRVRFRRRGRRRLRQQRLRADGNGSANGQSDEPATECDSHRYREC
jgi:hypothetical protein